MIHANPAGPQCTCRAQVGARAAQGPPAAPAAARVAALLLADRDDHPAGPAVLRLPAQQPTTQYTYTTFQNKVTAGDVKSVSIEQRRGGGDWKLDQRHRVHQPAPDRVDRRLRSPSS